MITVLTPAHSRTLTNLERVKRLLGVEDTVNDVLLCELIASASATVESYCRRLFARERLVETVKGYGGVMLMLGRAPAMSVASVLGDGSEPITDWSYDDAEAGILYRKRGWQDTVQMGWALSAYPAPRSNDPTYVITYSAGYLLVGDNVEVEQGLAVNGTLRAFTLDAALGSFPLTLVSGDRIRATGFANPANNGWFTVFSVAAQQLVVQETTLVTEPVAEGIRTITVETLPADLELVARECVRVFYTVRQRDYSVQSRSMGDLSITYRAPQVEAQVDGLPLELCGRLAPYRRLA